MQLCINIQIQKEIGLSQGGKAVFIETRNGFSPDRLTELAEGSIQLFQNQLEKSNSDITVEKLLKEIIYTYVESYIGLLAAVHNLKELLENNSNVCCFIFEIFKILIKFFPRSD